ncbi:hypothetical protein evm_007682 [Chilo suppressalis]|nr:hypothetical protein evm_007682 [Chilo suppressalis]
MPIVMSKDEWDRIGRWSEHGKEDPEMNVNKRNEELRRARQEAAEAKNTNFYKRYVRRKREEQQRLMYSARDTIFKNKDAPKLLLGAVIETVVQKERLEQLKFLQEQRQREADQKRQDDDDVIRRAKEWHALNQEKKARRHDANKRHQREILDQANEVSERNRVEHETELNFQKLDNIKAKEEMAAIKNFEEKFKAAEKSRIWRDMERARHESVARRREQQARDLLDDKLMHVLLRARARVEARRKDTEKEIKEEKLRVLEQISHKLESGDAARDAKEQAILDKAIQEKQAIAETRRQSDERKKQQFREERRRAREQFLRDEAARLQDFNTTRQWDIMNRFKNAELYEDFQEDLRKEKARKIKEYREDILKLWREREDREAREKAETRYFYGELAESKLRRADNQLLAHAAALVEEAAMHDRPTRPIQRAVDRYCKLYRLYPMPELPHSQQEHFKEYAPRDCSQPDPDYKEPTPPPSLQPPTAGKTATALDGAKRDGLQDISKRNCANHIWDILKDPPRPFLGHHQMLYPS